MTSPDVTFESIQQPLTHAIEQAVISTDLNGKINYWNPYAEKIYGWRPEEVIGKSIMDVMPESMMRARGEEIMALLAKGASWSGEFSVKHKDGNIVCISAIASPIFDEQKKMIGIVAISQDITHKKQVEDMLHFLNYASKELGSSLDYKTTLDKLTKLIVPKLADWFSLDILKENNELELITLAHRDPEKVQWGKELRKQFPPDMRATQGLPQVIKTGKSELYEHITSEMLQASAKTAEHAKVIEELGFSSVMIVPLTARDKIIGAVTFVSTKESNREYTEEDLRIAEEFAHRAAFAIDNSHLFQQAQEEIKERKRLEEKAKESEQRFQRMADTAPVMIWMSDKNRVTTYFNKGYTEFTGMSAKDLCDLGWKSIIHPDDITRFNEIVIPMFEEQRPFQIEFRIKRFDGVYRWILDTGTPRFDSNKNFIGYIGSCIDINETKHVQEELEKAKDQQEIIIQNIADGITVQDKIGKVIFMNDAAAQMCGYSSAAEMMSANPYEWKDRFEIADEAGNHLDPNFLPGRRALQGEENPECTLLYRNKVTREEHWSIVKARPVYDQNDEIILAVNVIVDITENKLAEKKKDEFIGIASHELKTPLTSVKAFTQLLQRYFKQNDDDKALEYLNRMENQLHRLTTLVEDLLDVSKIQAGKLAFNEEAFNFDEIIQETIEEIRPTAQKHSIVKTGSANIHVLADKYRIGQVLTNLITNAIKYSPHGGKIIVNTSADQDQVTVAVQDFGLGIPKEKLPKIFDRFYRVTGGHRESFPGLGLGLYISSEIMRRHKGKMWVKSEEGKGSTFYFSLPITLHSKLIVEHSK